jgi:hypothetical protein
MAKRTFVKVFFTLLFIIAFTKIFGQETIIKGRITDAKSGDPIPFCNIFFQGTNIGTTSDFVGFYTIRTSTPKDSLVASYIGYKQRLKPVKFAVVQEINFQLAEDIQQLKELVFVAEENPAFAILRNVVRNKNLNDKRSLDSYEYESYNKIELDLDNLTDKFRERNIVKKVKKVIDSVDQIAGDDGRPILPFFISESISKAYYRKTPEQKKEHIIKTKISGVGVEDGTLISQVIGSTFQEYNFYQNWLNIWDKEFVSPIADGWRAYYDVYLMDSVMIGNFFCYRLEVFPKRAGDLAFTGSIWIDKNTWALKQADLRIDKIANLNYIEKLKIQQELVPTSSGAWIANKSRVSTDFQFLGEFGISNQAAGILAKFYTSNKDIVVNQEYKRNFFDQAITMEEDVAEFEDNYWPENRHDPLTVAETNVIQMIDTLAEIPTIRRLSNTITYLSTGYIDKLWIFELGPFPLFFASNNIEKFRFRLGGITSIRFSRKFVFSGYGAYGIRDDKWKYGVGLDFIIDRKPWTKIGISRTYDIQQVGLTFDDVFSNIGLITFESYFRNIGHEMPFFLTENKINFQTDLKKGITQKLEVRQRDYNPINLDTTWNYSYRINPVEGGASPLRSNFSTSEISFESRWGKDEIWLIDDNKRFSLGPVKFPVITLRYTLGIKDFMGGDFNYQKVAVNIYKPVKMGILGISNFNITGSKIFGAVPLPLLYGHLGNESPFYVSTAFSTMGFSEFFSDQFISLGYRHHFEGFVLNTIPLFKRLKWRLVANANILQGNVSAKNENIHSDIGGDQLLPTQPLRSLSSKPYVELGYGIENIFRVFRIDAFHRLTYLENRTGSAFALKFSLQFVF